MSILFNFPVPFYSCSSESFVRRWSVEEIDDKIVVSAELPGKDKEDVDIRYRSENRTLKIEVKGGTSPPPIHIPRGIDPDKIEAKLEKGILTIEAPIKNTDKRITIK